MPMGMRLQSEVGMEVRTSSVAFTGGHPMTAALKRKVFQVAWENLIGSLVHMGTPLCSFYWELGHLGDIAIMGSHEASINFSSSSNFSIIGSSITTFFI